MIPYSNLTEDMDVSEETESTRTYRISDGKIQGFVDNLDALNQAIYKLLNTEKYKYPIYSFSYGIDFDSLIEKDPEYVKVELKRRIKECLLHDDRILSVENFQFTVTGDELLCAFDVISIYGTNTYSKVVKA